MNLFIVSDIHGSLKYAEEAIRRYRESKAGELIILGDFYYHGPRNHLPEGYDPMGVCKLLNPLKDELIAIKGNCDAEVDEYISEFPFRDFYLIRADGLIWGFIHGQHGFGRLGKADAVFSGHTHIARLEREGNVIYANPGSISLPKAADSRDYILIRDGKIELCDLMSARVISSLDVSS